jgi:16S rRNA (uracil1498-N3)-methyltransferase
MSDFRAFSPLTAAAPAEITLEPEESHHLVAVNRAPAGATVVVFNGRGTEWTCALRGADRRAARLEVQAARQAPPRPHALTLAQALPKGGGMDAIVAKATELGAARIVPLESERTQVHLGAERGDRKLAKWRTAAIEAAKQCGNPWLPEIGPVQTLADFLKGAVPAAELRLLASLEPGARSLAAALAAWRAGRTPGAAPASAAWLIGPEGDFSPAEHAAARAAGFAGVTLGPWVLRCETAAVAALSVLAYELGR